MYEYRYMYLLAMPLSDPVRRPDSMRSTKDQLYHMLTVLLSCMYYAYV